MPTTSNYSWPTPADTDYVKDGALAIRDLGNAIDSTVNTVQSTADAAIAKSVIDAKGDLLAGTADNTVARLAVGSNGQILMADSSTSTGVKWAAAPAAGLSWTLLNAGGTNLTGAATITVSGVSNIDHLMVLVESASSANASSQILIRFNSDAASNYYVLVPHEIWANSTYATANFQADSTGNTSGVQMAQMSGAAASVVTAYLYVNGAASTGIKTFQGAGGATASTSNGQYLRSIGGIYNASAAISSVSIVSSSGNFDAGKVYIYVA